MTEWENNFIIEQRVARLATVGAGGNPAVIPVVYAFDGNLFFSPLDAKPKRVAVTQLQRVRNIQVNPSVALIIDSYDEDWQRLAWVHVRGNASITFTGDKYTSGIRLLQAKYRQYEQMPLTDCPLIVIEPIRISSWRASTKTKGEKINATCNCKT